MAEELIVTNPATGEEAGRVDKDTKDSIEKKIRIAHENSRTLEK